MLLLVVRTRHRCCIRDLGFGKRAPPLQQFLGSILCTVASLAPVGDELSRNPGRTVAMLYHTSSLVVLKSLDALFEACPLSLCDAVLSAGGLLSHTGFHDASSATQVPSILIVYLK